MSLIFDVAIPRRDFNLELQGEFGRGTVGIYGPSGAGKSSLFSLISGLERPKKGRIILNGRSLTDTDAGLFVPPHKRNIGVVFQEKLLFPHLSVKENLLFGTRYHKRSLQGFGLKEAAELLDLEPLLNSMPHEISGGEQQRTTIGRALLCSPQLLLLDEPFNAVDSSLRSTILPYLRKIQRRMDIPMLVISHDLPDIQSLTDDIYLVNRGRCDGHGRIIELLTRETPWEEAGEFSNVLRLSDPREKEEGLYKCRVTDSQIPLRITISHLPSHPEKEFTRTIKPHEIALSRSHIPHISMQNQIKGKLTGVFTRKEGKMCLVDIGVPLAVMVTTRDYEKLGLKEGDEVFTLFKAHSLTA